MFYKWVFIKTLYALCLEGFIKKNKKDIYNMKAFFTGNLGRDAELKSSTGGKDFIVFSVADVVGYGDKKVTQWVNCTLFGKVTEGQLIKYLVKGALVSIIGDVSIKEWQDKNGITKSNLSCVVSDVKLLGGVDKDFTPVNNTKETPLSNIKKPAALPFGDDDISF